LQEISDLFAKWKWDDMADIIISAIKDLKQAGADFAALATNTPHIAFDRIKDNSPLYLLSIMDATADEVELDNKRMVGLLGTKYTMGSDFYQRALKRRGIETMVPYDFEREKIDRIIWEELVHGIIKDSSKEIYKMIVRSLQLRGCEGVILGCTEIPMLIKPEDSPVKTYDTTTIHAKAILEYALKE
jgi:aspartate racemase